MKKMLRPKKVSLLIWCFLLTSIASVPSRKLECECGLFLRDDLWRPSHMALSLQNDIKMDCTDAVVATDKCKEYCLYEMITLLDLFKRNPRLLKEYPPSQTLPCNLLPKETVSFSKVCNNENYVLSSRELGPTVCCDSNSGKPKWCGANGDLRYRVLLDVDQNIAESRKLDLKKEPDDESHNEIDGSSTTISESKKPGSSVAVSDASWTNTALKFFGYNSFGDLITNIDIFALPGKVQYAIKNYKDEVSMGRCYMEFTTFKVFTKRENPFEDLLRKKRDVNIITILDELTNVKSKRETGDNIAFDEIASSSAEYQSPRTPTRDQRNRRDAGDITRFDEFASSSEVDAQTQRSHQKDQRASQNEPIMRILSVLSGMLEKSESTKPYASMLNTFLPFVSTMMSSGDSSSSDSVSPLSMILKFAGPLMSQFGNSGSATNSIESIEKVSNNEYPQRPPSSSSSNGGSDFGTLAMSMIGNVISNYFNPPPATESNAEMQEIRTTSTTTKSPPTRRPIQQTQSSSNGQNPDFISNAVQMLMKMFLQRGNDDSAAARPVHTKKPTPEPKPPTPPAQLEKQEPKTFIDILLELIRPVFISIVGNAPGDSGEKEIRRISSLSTLGRVDDTLKEEVDSPLFCLKRYMVNKAWTLTETGVRTVVSKFTPEEQARMMQRMLS